jgi:hypothetical protein
MSLLAVEELSYPALTAGSKDYISLVEALLSRVSASAVSKLLAPALSLLTSFMVAGLTKSFGALLSLRREMGV